MHEINGLESVAAGVVIRSHKIELVPTDSVKPNNKNRNKHPESQIERLVKIITHQGFRQPLIISNRSGLLVAGHGRLIAAKRLGMTEVPVIFQDFENEEMEYQAQVSDNAIALQAELDLAGINVDIGELGPFDIELLGLENFSVEVADKVPGCDEDDAPAVHAESRVVRGDVFSLGRHRLMCGDSTMIDDVEQLMAGEKAELCFTSPPYADQREYGGGLELSTEHLATFIRASLKSVNYYAVNLGYSRKNGEVNQYWDDYIKEARECAIKLLSWNVWSKGVCGSVGNQTAMFGISHEFIFVFGEHAKDLNRTVPNKHAGSFNENSTTRQSNGSTKKRKSVVIGDFSQMQTVFSCDVQRGQDGIEHPARFPVALPEAYIEAMTGSNQIVYEPFGGSGTTLIAAEKTNRKSMTMEIDPKYCAVILDRWAKYTGQDPVRESDGMLWSAIKSNA